MTTPRCAHCPVPDGSHCDGTCPGSVSCRLAASGEPHRLRHVVGRSRFPCGPAPTRPSSAVDAEDWAKVLACPHREEAVSYGCCNGTLARCRAGKAIDPNGTVDRSECLACIGTGGPPPAHHKDRE